MSTAIPSSEVAIGRWMKGAETFIGSLARRRRRGGGALRTARGRGLSGLAAGAALAALALGGAVGSRRPRARQRRRLLDCGGLVRRSGHDDLGAVGEAREPGRHHALAGRQAGG